MRNNKLDNKDILILEELEKNARQSARKIAEKVGLPTTTVLKRIEKLEGAGVIKGYSAVIDRKKIGVPETAIVMIELKLSEQAKSETDQETILNKLAEIPNVLDAFLMTGQYDVMLKVCGKDSNDIGQYIVNYIRSMPFVGQSITSLVVLNAKECLGVPLLSNVLCEREEYRDKKSKIETAKEMKEGQ